MDKLSKEDLDKLRELIRCEFANLPRASDFAKLPRASDIEAIFARELARNMEDMKKDFGDAISRGISIGMNKSFEKFLCDTRPGVHRPYIVREHPYTARELYTSVSGGPVKRTGWRT